jgi:hypothetical protein
VVYAAGQGAEDERQVAEASEATHIAAGPFGRRERLLDARHLADLGALSAEARAALPGGLPRHTFTAAVVSAPGMAYGQHWHWGDRVTASFQGERIDCHIDEVHIIVEAGRETVRAWLRAENAAPPPLNENEAVERLSSAETEVTYQQVQRGSLPAGARLTLPEHGHLLVYARYEMTGSLELGAGARLVVLM